MSTLLQFTGRSKNGRSVPDDIVDDVLKAGTHNIQQILVVYTNKSGDLLWLHNCGDGLLDLTKRFQAAIDKG